MQPVPCFSCQRACHLATHAARFSTRNVTLASVIVTYTSCSARLRAASARKVTKASKARRAPCAGSTFGRRHVMAACTWKARSAEQISKAAISSSSSAIVPLSSLFRKSTQRFFVYVASRLSLWTACSLSCPSVRRISSRNSRKYGRSSSRSASTSQRRR